MILAQVLSELAMIRSQPPERSISASVSFLRAKCLAVRPVPDSLRLFATVSDAAGGHQLPPLYIMFEALCLFLF